MTTPTSSSVRQHLPLVALLIVVACIIAVVAVQDQGFAERPPASWTLDVGGAPVAYLESGDLLVVKEHIRGTFDLLRGVSVANGEVRWRTRVNGWASVEVRAAEPDAFLVEEHDDSPDSAGVALLNARDGSVRWTHTRTTSTNQLSATVAGDQVLLPADAELAAYDRTTGEHKWTWHPSDGCQITGLDSAAELAAVAIQCADARGRLVLLDTRDGTVRGQRQLGDTATAVAVSADVVAVGSSSSCRILDSHGRDVARLDHSTCGDPRCFWTVGEVVVTCTYGVPSMDRTVTAIERRSGTRRWQLPLAAESGTVRGDALHVIAPGPTPIGLPLSFSIDARSGAILAMRLLSGHKALGLPGRGTVVEEVFLDTDTTHLRLTALESGTGGFLGGAAEGAWPDPCTLLNRTTLRDAYPGRRFTVVAARREGWLAAHRPLACRFLAADGSGTLVTVDLLWVGPTPDESAQVFTTIPNLTSGLPVEGLADQAVLTRLAFSAENDTVCMRLGRTIVRLSVTSDTQALSPLAEALVEQLSGQPRGRP